jgi:Pyruvate/2-oxoacid:ferredoxin oxidoreductase gamma subunit
VAAKTLSQTSQVQALVPYANGIQAAFIKTDKVPILSRDPPEPDFLVLFDTRIDAGVKDAKDGTIIIANSPEKPKLKAKNKIKLFYVDADGIAVASKHRMANFVMLGALAKVSGRLSMKHIKTALEEEGLAQEFGAVEGA